MSDHHRSTDSLQRRRFLALGAGAGAAAIAGCASGVGPTGGGTRGDGDGSGSSTTDTGSFRLLISDQPSAIGDFDSLEVTLDTARIFGGRDGDDEETAAGASDTDDSGGETASPNGTTAGTTSTASGANETTTAAPTGTATPTATATPTTEADDADDGDEPEDADDADGEDEGDDGDGGFTVLDLSGATVDLTQVVGEKAMPVFDGELPAGRYTKVELHAAEVGGVVDGESVPVKLPSGKLQITSNFEIRPGESTSFVFDITVVKKGQGGYNLIPVISESGVAGRDVDVEEVGNGGPATGAGDGNTTDGGGDATDADGGPPGDGGPAEDRPGGS